MNNHIHLLISGELKDISNLMFKINTTFAVKYNRENDRVGHVFQGPFKSEVVESRQYFRGLIRYIHNNPIKAHLVDSCSEYRWSSYNEYINKSRMVTSETIENVLKYFDSDLNYFVSFHSGSDTLEYLDDREDLRNRHIEIIKIYQECYCNQHDVKHDVLSDDHKADIAKKILKATNIKANLIADILDIKSYKVYAIKKDLNEY